MSLHLPTLCLATAALVLLGCGAQESSSHVEAPSTAVGVDTASIVATARTLLDREPQTVTAFRAERSAGGPHDYYSEGRYWWPNPDDPDGPYIRKDGQSFTGLFLDHRNALADLSATMSALTVAYLHTGEASFAEAAKRHARAWFVDTATVMHPRLTYAQAIKGITTGRGIGIIDTKSLIYVASSIDLLAAAGVFGNEELATIRQWFGDYGEWLTSSSNGQDERDNGNNHSTWWGAQLAAYARVAERRDLLDTARLQYRRSLALQMDSLGVFPDEVSRTRPFHYMEYNLDGFATLAHLASAPQADLWSHASDAGTLRKSIDWYLSYHDRLAQWPYPAELEPEPHYEPADYLYLTALHYDDAAYAKTYRQLAAAQPPADEAELAVLTWPQPNPTAL